MKKIIALAALAALSVAASAADLVQNGSFEADAVAPGTWSIFATPTDWTPIGSGLEIRDNVAGTAEDGSNFIELDGYQNMSITQTLATVVGQTYTFSFWYADRVGTDPSTNGVSYSIGGLAGTIAGTGSTAWQEFTGSFVATSTSTLLTLGAAGTSDSYGSSIDNVSVISAVPEPTTTALFLAGLGVLGFSARRRGRG